MRDSEGPMEKRQGILYVVSTPIGNLEDITLRALRVLKEVDIIAAEDTRHTQKLLSHYQIHTPLTSYHDFNKEEKTAVLIHRLKEDQKVALTSDAGTPGISDPGYYLITHCLAEGITVSPVPGITAAITALSVAGLPTDSFLFEGFLPRKRTARIKKLEALRDEKRTLILYESPYRLSHTLPDLLEVLGDRRVAVARELTKVFEEVIRGRLSEVIPQFQGKRVRGEITLIVEGVPRRSR